MPSALQEKTVDFRIFMRYNDRICKKEENGFSVKINMNDYIVRGMTMDGYVKLAAIRSTNLVAEAARIHNTTANATAAFGRCLTAASMMGNMQKVENGSMTMQVRGGGPIGGITVVSDAVGNVRGYVLEPHVPLVEKHPGKLDVGATVGVDGTMTIIRDLQMKEPYVGSIELVTGEIGDDVTAYFVQSEQIPTACALGVLVDRDQSVKVAGGYLIQLLPGAPDEIIDKLEEGIRRAGAITPMLEAGMTPEDILGQVCGELGVLFMGTQEVSYKCYCSRERMEAALISLGRKELSEIAAEGKPIDMTCQFCDAVHSFSPADIEKLLKSI